jgi:hypothetical protein
MFLRVRLLQAMKHTSTTMNRRPSSNLIHAFNLYPGPFKNKNQKIYEKYQQRRLFSWIIIGELLVKYFHKGEVMSGQVNADPLKKLRAANQKNWPLYGEQRSFFPIRRCTKPYFKGVQNSHYVIVINGTLPQYLHPRPVFQRLLSVS